MDSLKIIGGHRLQGNIRISGAKNSALPLTAVSLLSNKELRLTNVPDLVDIDSMIKLLQWLGVEITKDYDPVDNRLSLNMKAHEISHFDAPYDLVRKMRTSILVLGPLLGRYGQAKISLPGGCAIGVRPLDIHLSAMEALGATIDIQEGNILANAPKGLRGNRIVFPFPSVGATENIMMAAVLAKGETIIENAAKEPEIIDLAQCLSSLGANIKGAGSSTIYIQGQEILSEGSYAVIPDRIEAGSFACAAAITDGDVLLTNVIPEHLNTLTTVMQEMGVSISYEAPDQIRIQGCPSAPCHIVTEPYPGYPTDLQAQLMALSLRVKGTSIIEEHIFENRFMHIQELARMGAQIKFSGNRAEVTGGVELTGAPVMATDLRASMSLIIAGLYAKGETHIQRIYHLDRGYEKLHEKLNSCHADIQRIS